MKQKSKTRSGSIERSEHPVNTRQKPAESKPHTPVSGAGFEFFVEELEDRRLLSATLAAAADPALSTTATSALIHSDAATASPDKAHAAAATQPAGYSPAQIAKMYGFNLVSGTGTGQTIAIVDAYNDPNISSDLAVFDKTYGLAAANLTVVNQSGSTQNLPANNGDWSGEIALDVEWAHAMAPGAKIVLVEANSDTLTNLLAAVNTARNIAGVSVVSMSWGGSEFSSETRYDSYFTTPASHTGVTFVASSGDSGSYYGPSWPASSPNVLSVGGTTLYTTTRGTWGLETGWSSSGGGASSYETVPSYQAGVQSTGRRTTPDVSYDADPNTGFAVYDSVADSYGDPLGWGVVGGTSAGAPQWAALIAIADQLRVASGVGTLDGATATLPTLYSLYGSGGTAATYSTAFHDVTSGRTSPFLAAHTGYDGVTGLGSPKVGAVVSALVDAVSASVSAATARSTASTATARAAAAVRGHVQRFGDLLPASVTDASADSATTTVATARLATTSLVSVAPEADAESSTNRYPIVRTLFESSIAPATPATPARCPQSDWTPWLVDEGSGFEAPSTQTSFAWKSESEAPAPLSLRQRPFTVADAAIETVKPSENLVFGHTSVQEPAPDDRDIGVPVPAGYRIAAGLAFGAILVGNWYARKAKLDRKNEAANDEELSDANGPFNLGPLDPG